MHEFIFKSFALILVALFLGGGSCSVSESQQAEITGAGLVFGDALEIGPGHGLTGPEIVKRVGKPPYSSGSSPSKQRYVVASSTEIIIFNLADDIITTLPWASTIFGSLFLQPATPGLPDRVYNYGPTGGFTCEDIPNAYCLFDGQLGGSANNTTDAQCSRDVNGVEQCNEYCRVQGGDIACGSVDTTPVAGPVSVFDGTAFSTLIPDTPSPLIAYAPLMPTTGIGVTNDGYAYFVDTYTDVATLISSNIGSDVRSVLCDETPSNTFACVIQSFSDSYTIPCSGTNASDFTCGSPIATADAVTPGFAVTKAGNIALAIPSFNTAALNILEVSPAAPFNVVFQANIVETDWQTLFKTSPKPTFTAPGHALLDANSNKLVVSGNGSNNVIILDLGAFSGLVGAVPVGTWFK